MYVTYYILIYLSKSAIHQNFTLYRCGSPPFIYFTTRRDCHLNPSGQPLLVFVYLSVDNLSSGAFDSPLCSWKPSDRKVLHRYVQDKHNGSHDDGPTLQRRRHQPRGKGHRSFNTLQDRFYQ
jgi:hypothetical protein